MGTRNLVMVIYQKKTVIAQYGQYDGYPAYTADYLLRFMLDKSKVSSLKHQLDSKNVTLLTYEKAESKFGKEWNASNFSSAFHSTAGCGILDIIIQGGHHFYLQDSTSFSRDSLFCEWGYVVNLDNMSLEVYKGYNKEPLVKGERFFRYNRYHVNDAYKPIKYLTTIFDVKTPANKSIDEFVSDAVRAIELVSDLKDTISPII